MDKYLSCANVTTNWEPSDQAEHILRLGGDLFFHCGNIIYTKVGLILNYGIALFFVILTYHF